MDLLLSKLAAFIAEFFIALFGVATGANCCVLGEAILVKQSSSWWRRQRQLNGLAVAPERIVDAGRNWGRARLRSRGPGRGLGLCRGMRSGGTSRQGFGCASFPSAKKCPARAGRRANPCGAMTLGHMDAADFIIFSMGCQSTRCPDQSPPTLWPVA